MNRLSFIFGFIGIVVVLMVIEMSTCINERAAAVAKHNQPKSQYFKMAGHLNFKYDPGVFVPLRNGKILALDGFQVHREGKPENVYLAEDGKRYGSTPGGMTELFDPATGETKVLTKMPFWFNRMLFPKAGK